MNNSRIPNYPQRQQQLVCPQHPPNIFVSYCSRCSVPLCLECQDIHTNLHYKNNSPVQLKSIARIQEETETKLRDALATYRRYIHSIDSILKNPVHYDRVLEEIDNAHRSLVKDINLFFVNLKQKYENLRRMPDFHSKLAALAKRESELEDHLMSLGYQKTLDVITSTNSDRFVKEFEKDTQDVESIVEKNKQLLSSAFINEDELQNVLRYNLDRYVNKSRYLKTKVSAYRVSTESSPIKYALPPVVETRTAAAGLNRSVVLKRGESNEKDSPAKNDRSFSFERGPFSILKTEISNSNNGFSSKLPRRGMNELFSNSPQLGFLKGKDSNYPNIRTSKGVKFDFSALDEQSLKLGGKAGNTDRI